MPDSRAISEFVMSAAIGVMTRRKDVTNDWARLMEALAARIEIGRACTNLLSSIAQT